MPLLFIAVTEWLEATSIATAIRQSTWLYPILEIIHILGIVFVAGAAMLFDVQLLSKNTSHFPASYDSLLSWSRWGLIIVIPSGVLLYMTNAVALTADPVFWTKLSLLLVAGLNAYVFYLRVSRYSGTSSNTTVTQHRGRFHAVASLIVWTAIIACGRLLAY